MGDGKKEKEEEGEERKGGGDPPRLGSPMLFSALGFCRGCVGGLCYFTSLLDESLLQKLLKTSGILGREQ